MTTYRQTLEQEYTDAVDHGREVRTPREYAGGLLIENRRLYPDRSARRILEIFERDWLGLELRDFWKDVYAELQKAARQEPQP